MKAISVIPGKEQNILLFVSLFQQRITILLLPLLFLCCLSLFVAVKSMPRCDHFAVCSNFQQHLNRILFTIFLQNDFDLGKFLYFLFFFFFFPLCNFPPSLMFTVFYHSTFVFLLLSFLSSAPHPISFLNIIIAIPLSFWFHIILHKLTFLWFISENAGLTIFQNCISLFTGHSCNLD